MLASYTLLHRPENVAFYWCSFVSRCLRKFFFITSGSLLVAFSNQLLYLRMSNLSVTQSTLSLDNQASAFGHFDKCDVLIGGPFRPLLYSYSLHETQGSISTAVESSLLYRSRSPRSPAQLVRTSKPEVAISEAVMHALRHN
jgi:hypothetical protein